MNENNHTIKTWYLYIVENKLGHWYTGITNDLDRRVEQHNNGTGAKSLRGKGPISLIIAISGLTKVQAAKLEWQIKQLTKAQKRQLVVEAISDSDTSVSTNLVIAFETCVSFSKLILSNESLTE
ncbi:GIY-YIG nuclease family protein [Pseudoalteromonas luteoviolacea]|nr:GIY-YIG nuclease family protein [Pseudoalteromonas luteoviolacea]MBQ4905938.1 GIY-YIG nuclease family protein [Pseudoalteromonas luteoviolacea]